MLERHNSRQILHPGFDAKSLVMLPGASPSFWFNLRLLARLWKPKNSSEFGDDDLRIEFGDAPGSIAKLLNFLAESESGGSYTFALHKHDWFHDVENVNKTLGISFELMTNKRHYNDNDHDESLKHNRKRARWSPHGSGQHTHTRYMAYIRYILVIFIVIFKVIIIAPSYKRNE